MKHPLLRALLVSAMAYPLTPISHAIDVTGDQVVCGPGQTISETNIVANADGDIARVTGGQITLSSGVNVGGGLSSGELAAFIQSGGDLISSSEIDILRNKSSGDVYFEISGGKYNANEANGVKLNAPFAVNGRGGDSIQIVVSGGELHLDTLSLSSRGSSNNGTSYTFAQTGGVTKFRSCFIGTSTSPADVSVTISGGEFLDDFSWHNTTIDQGTFHVLGSASTNVRFLGDLTATANATFKFTIDSGGVTPIDINKGSDDTLNATIDLELDGITPAANETFTLMTATNTPTVYDNLALASADAALWQLQVNGNDLEAKYVGVPQTFTIYAHPGDASILPDGSGRPTNESVTRVGRRKSGTDNYALAMAFALPDLKGGTIQSAELSINVDGWSNSGGLENLDLYNSALFDYMPGVKDASLYVDGSNPTNPDMLLVSDDFVEKADASANGFGWFDSVDLTSEIEDIYLSGAQPEAYTFFTLTNDQYPTQGYSYYRVNTADTSTPPTLTITTVGSNIDGTVWGVTDSITSNGITWTFDEPVTYGTFVTGDFWIVGPVDVVDITNHLNSPNYTPRDGQNGSMLNPLVGHDRNKQGYDDGLGSYQASLNVARPNDLPVSSSNPISLSPDDTLVSMVSWLYNSSSDKEPGCPSFNGGTGAPRPVTRSAGILTVLDQSPPDYSFRPPYAGDDNTVNYSWSDLDWTKLQDLTPPSSNVPVVANLENQMKKPWVDHVYEYLGAMVHPSTHMPNYGRDMTHIMLQTALMLHLDFSQLPGSPTKDQLLMNLVQFGIDSKGVADFGGGWRANGGHGLGRKFPILFAGVLLDDQDMMDVGIWGDGDGNGNGGTDFQEFQNCFYVSQAEVDLTQSGLIANGGQWDPDSRDITNGNITAYTTADIGLPEWGIRHTYKPQQDNGHLSAKYRSINYGCHPGSALAVHIMGLESEWNHDAFLDYCDRIMAINGGGSGVNGLPSFAKEMWTLYRADYPPVWSE